MITYTVRLNKLSQRIFVSREAAQDFVENFKEQTGREDLFIIERRTGNDTSKPETYT